MTNSQSTANSSGLSNEQVATNIEAIVALHASSVRSTPRHQRIIEAFTRNIGRPLFLYLMLGAVASWIVYNGAAPAHRWPQFDRPPFEWLQGAVSLSALIVTTMVLITQNRQAALAEQRSHLDIQVNLLAEQKITKLIVLVEELRKDLPNVRNRRDPEAELMAQNTDPLSVVEELKRNLENAETLDENSSGAN